MFHYSNCSTFRNFTPCIDQVYAEFEKTSVRIEIFGLKTRTDFRGEKRLSQVIQDNKRDILQQILKFNVAACTN